MPSRSEFPGELTITREERDALCLGAPRLKLASLLLELHGYVILREAAGPDVIAAAADAFGDVWRDVLDAQLSESGTPTPTPTPRRTAVAWVRKRRYRIFPALVPAFADPWIAANPFATPLLGAMLGADYYCKSISSDTCCDGALMQAPHRDNGPSASRTADALCVNVPLVECGLHNGPLELWPGTHLWSNFETHRLVFTVQDGSNDRMNDLVSHMRSLKVELRPGDVLIRDLGTWHRGTPNPQPQPRTMMTTVYGSRRVGLYPYGSPYFNLDRDRWATLAPAVKQRFTYAFDGRDPLHTALHEERAYAAQHGLAL